MRAQWDHALRVMNKYENLTVRIILTTGQGRLGSAQRDDHAHVFGKVRELALSPEETRKCLEFH